MNLFRLRRPESIGLLLCSVNALTTERAKGGQSSFLSGFSNVFQLMPEVVIKACTSRKA